VKAGPVRIGGDAPISVQTMWKEPLAAGNLAAVKGDLDALADAGCDLVRFAVPDMDSADLLGELARSTRMPLVADIHFDYRIALRCLDSPVAKIRVNPGTIGDAWKVEEVVRKAADSGAALRIGVNGGSLPPKFSQGKTLAQSMVEAAESELDILEKLHFHDVAFSLKSSDVHATVDANLLFAQRHDYPLHLGVTEAGPLVPGIVKSSIGISALLGEGVGDTIRVSLSASSMDEVWAGNEILRTLGLRAAGVNLVSCPRCGRSSFDVHGFLHDASFLTHYKGRPLTIAVMGCVVNGPAEARHADIGITGAGSTAIIFRHGKIVRRVSFAEALSSFKEEFAKVCAEA
jgi:(E)-4-hydroxy-3-methylbut-2-enyl-diphosphate synthase